MTGAEVLNVGRDASWLTIQGSAQVLVLGLVVHDADGSSDRGHVAATREASARHIKGSSWSGQVAAMPITSAFI
jgi:hypothetical protein